MPGEDAPARLRDLAAVEEISGKYLAPSIGERLARVCRELDWRTPPIETVRVVDSLEALPRRWREVLARLPVVSQPLDAAGEGFLGKLEEARLQYR